MIKKIFPVLSQVMLINSNFQVKMRVRDVNTLLQGSKPCYNFFNYQDQLIDDQLKNTQQILLREQILLNKQISQCKTKDEWLSIKLNYYKKIEKFLKSDINQNRSFTLSYTLNVINEASEIMWELAFFESDIFQHQLSENIISPVLIPILENAKADNFSDIIFLKGLIPLLKFFQKSFLISKFPNQNIEQLYELINDNYDYLEIMAKQDFLSGTEKIFFCNGMQNVMFNFFIAGIFKIRQDYQQSSQFLIKAFNQLCEIIEKYKKEQKTHQISETVENVIKRRILVTAMWLRYQLERAPNIISVPYHQFIVKLFEQLPDYFQPEEILKAKMDLLNVLQLYQLTFEAKKLQNEIDLFKNKHKLTFDYSTLLSWKLIQYRNMKKNGDNLDQIVKEIDDMDVYKSDNKDCHVSWLQYQQMQFFTELNESRFEKTRYRFDRIYSFLYSIFRIKEPSQVNDVQFINQDIIDEIIITKELPDRRYYLQKLLQIMKDNLGPNFEDQLIRLNISYNITAISFCQLLEGDGSKEQCFELLSNFVQTFKENNIQNHYFVKLIDLYYLVLEETTFYKELKVFIKNSINYAQQSKAEIQRNTIIQQLNQLLVKLEKKEHLQN